MHAEALTAIARKSAFTSEFVFHVFIMTFFDPVKRRCKRVAQHGSCEEITHEMLAEHAGNVLF